MNRLVTAAERLGSTPCAVAHPRLRPLWQPLISGESGHTLHTAMPTFRAPSRRRRTAWTGTGIAYDNAGNLTAHPCSNRRLPDDLRRQQQDGVVRAHGESGGDQVRRRLMAYTQP
ncbi:MAG: hypothetical protein R2748_12060 [Bryobacterales bacterium]